MPRIPVQVEFGVKGIITVECHSADGELLHREVQENLVTDEGLAALDGRRLGAVINEGGIRRQLVAGRRGDAPAASDTMRDNGGQSFTTFYSDDTCGETNRPFLIPQTRSLVATSDDNGSVGIVSGFEPGPPAYIHQTITRIIKKEEQYFPASVSGAGGNAGSEETWREQGYRSLDIEASYIKELGFCSRDGDPFAYITGGTPGSGCEEYSFLYHQGDLWNRVVLDQSIGYAIPQGAPNPPEPYAVPDVLLAEDAQITVTFELRVYPDPSVNTQVLNVAGQAVTAETRVVDLDSAARWWSPTGFMHQFGGWSISGNEAVIGEPNAMPPDLTTAPPNIWSFEAAADSAEKLSSSVPPGGPYSVTLRFEWGPSSGLFPTGIGQVQHLNPGGQAFGGVECMITTFTPKIQKTDTETFRFDVTYTWSRRP